MIYIIFEGLQIVIKFLYFSIYRSLFLFAEVYFSIFYPVCYVWIHLHNIGNLLLTGEPNARQINIDLLSTQE